MANHVRQQVRDAVKAILIAAGTRAGRDVRSARVQPINADTENMPVVVVHTPSERTTTQTMSGTRLQERNIDVVLEMFERPETQDAADKLDTLCKECENALLADVTLGGVIKDINEAEGITTTVTITKDADQDIAVAVMRLVAVVYTVEGAADVAV